MDKFLSGIPKNTLAFLAIAGGILVIVIAQPPASICDQQMEVIRRTQKNFLYADEKYPKAKTLKTTKYQYLTENCKMTNSPGGCYELFSELKNMVHDVNTLPRECASAAGSETQIKRALWDSIDLMARLAWGSKAPTAYHEKFGWLDKADISLFCALKASATNVSDDATFTSFREKTMMDMPGAKELPRNQVWDMSLFSENCARYP